VVEEIENELSANIAGNTFIVLFGYFGVLRK